MSIGEQLDSLAAEERLTSLTLIQVGGGWQVYVNKIVAQRAGTPDAAIAKALDMLPTCQEYEAKFGAGGVSARARCSVCNEPQIASPSGATCSNGHGGADPAPEAGVFD